MKRDSISLNNKNRMLTTIFRLSVIFIPLLTLLCFFSIKSASAIGNKLMHPVLLEKIDQSSQDNRQYEVIELNNKMRVLLVSDPNAVKSLASLAVPVGSLYDPINQQGLAHYTEHMVLMGSKKYPEPSNFSQFLSRHAGSYNASTSANRTAFYFEVENSAFKAALDRLADAIANPLLDPKFADKERNAVNAEMTMARSNDGFRIKQVDAETINQSHPAAQFSGGNLETLSDKTGDGHSTDDKLHAALVNFYQHYYSANLMVGVLYSNQSIKALNNLAEKSFGYIANKNVTLSPISGNALPVNTVAKQINMIPAQPKKVLYLQFPIENNLAKFADKSDEYIAYMLSNRSHNTLFDQLQKRGLIESLHADNDPIRYGNSGTFSITATLTDAGLAQKDTVIAAIFDYLKLIQKEGISNDYYQEIKKVLTLDFKYQNIVRDMSYVEWLSDQMLLYPIQNILDADYVADNFNKTAIMNRLKELTIDNVRIWTIAPELEVNKTAYFVDAPYKISDITSEQKANWLNLGRSFKFSLPELNPYIADDFFIVPQNIESKSDTIFNPKGNHIHFASHYFANQPKAAIALSLRSNQALDDAKSQVAFNLLDYIVSRNLAQLQFQASVAGISLATTSDNGLLITAKGFSQHLTEMVLAVLTSYQNSVIDEQSLTLAKSWYLQQLDASEQAKSYLLAMQPVNALSSFPYFSRQQKREVVASITVEDIKRYQHNLIADSVPYMLSLGNISEQASLAMYQSVKNNFIKSDNQQEFTPNPMIKIDRSMNAKFTQHAASTDNALLMSYIPENYDEITSSVYSYTLYKIVSSWFYDQLRSNEQLGYAVFALPINVGESSGIGFLIQSNQYDPYYLQQRYQHFYPTMLEKLAKLTEDDIEQYKKGVVEELTMPPQTLDEEFARYMNDYRLSRFSFDSRDKKIQQTKEITKQDLVKFYQKAVIENRGLILVSQVLGKVVDSVKAPKEISEFTDYPDASVLQQELLKNE
ncbi:pitrilysin [Orbaceae bacterium ESL0721]|nr:pitrilysin [Orbaceae bacterium ESL0721]